MTCFAVYVSRSPLAAKFFLGVNLTLCVRPGKSRFCYDSSIYLSDSKGQVMVTHTIVLAGQNREHRPKLRLPKDSFILWYHSPQEGIRRRLSYHSGGGASLHSSCPTLFFVRVKIMPSLCVYGDNVPRAQNCDLDHVS